VSRTALILILMASVLSVVIAVGAAVWRSSSLGAREKIEAMMLCVALGGLAATFLVLFVPKDDNRPSDVVASSRLPLASSSPHSVLTGTPTPPDRTEEPDAGPSPSRDLSDRPDATESDQEVPDVPESVDAPEEPEETGTTQSAPRSSAPDRTTHGAHLRATKGAFVGLCMEAAGDALVTARCATTDDQLWTRTDRGEIVGSDGGCMTPDGAGGGVRMRIAPCDGGADQQWRFSDGRIMSGVLCLTIYGPYTDPGTWIQTWNTSEDPHLADEEFWRLVD